MEIIRDRRETNPVKRSRKEKLEALEKCFAELESYKQNKLILEYPTFFIPGWTGENCAAWKEPYEKIPKKYKKYYCPAKHWVNDIIQNVDQAYFITLEEESKKSSSFIELGEQLKVKLLGIAKDNPINLVGHSMGGLDIRAAVLDDEGPCLNIKNVITVGTPNNGTGEAGLFGIRIFRNLIKRFTKFTPWQIAQGHSMFSKGEFIKLINTLENRIRFLSNVSNFYVLMGLRDAVVKGSPKLNLEGISEDSRKKVKVLQTSSADHSGKDGITQDPRVFLPITKILCGLELENNYNYGYIFRK